VSAPPALPGDGAAAADLLHTRRCARHPSREAVARCPSCGGFFCRECVVEHDGRFLCSSCLERQAAAASSRRLRWPAVRRAAGLAAAAFTAGLMFYALGSLLLSLPPKFHEGTIWNKAGGIDDP
jgi:hypothetical protein